MSVRTFGTFRGTEILDITLAADGIEARIITWGAVLRDLVVPARGGGRRHVLLGLNTLDDYVRHSPDFGAVVGRYANRIGDARFRLGGREVDVVANENGNELHGGPDGFGRRPWALVAHDARRAHLALVSEDGDMGSPGRLFAFATYEIVAPATLRFTLQAIAEEPTPVNMTVHGYYNLDGSADARDHRLEIASDLYLPTDAGLIPTGEVSRIAGTPFDFRTARPVRPREPGVLYDVNYVLRRERTPEPTLARAATLASDRSGIAMELWTTEPGLQLYDGHKVDVPVPGLGGARYGACAGIALEPQRFPDAPNHAHFPPCTLPPGEVSRQMTELRFVLTDG